VEEPALKKKIIELKNVRKTYQMGEVQVHALRGVDSEIYEGEFVAIMGPSGSGKSTLMNMVGCLDTPSEGHVYLEGRDIAEMTEDELARARGKKIGFIFQKFNLIPYATAWENVELPAIFQSVCCAEREKEAKKYLSKVGLGKRANHLPSELSGGEQQRVAIARSLMTNPAVILADEPTGNLDSKTGAEIMDLLVELNEEGKTIVMVTHDAKTAKRAGRTIRILDGKIDSRGVRGK
jgi:putative ABC transport system ATP-binding protein